MSPEDVAGDLAALATFELALAGEDFDEDLLVDAYTVDVAPRAARDR
jgi:hypothetical protein